MISLITTIIIVACAFVIFFFNNRPNMLSFAVCGLIVAVIVQVFNLQGFF